MSTSEEKTGFEPWAWGAFALGGLVALTFLYLGLRPGGEGPILAFTLVLPLLGTAAGLWMAVGLVWSVLRKPVLQRGRLKALLTCGACVWACSWPIPYPSSHEGSPSTVAFRLPFEGEWSVRWAGDERAQNAMLLDPARRFGIVFEGPVDGVPPLTVRAPAAGELRFVGEAPPGSGSWAVVLEVAPEEFLVVEGLVQTTVAFPSPLPVPEGATLGALGDRTLTLSLTDRPEVGRGEGIPFSFSGYRSGEKPVARGFPVRGERVSPDLAASGR